ncbi:SNF2-related protein [Gordonia sp. GONU]|uniref:SNF2-related protein n=1 Tax=Gordonia amicalis TaxID=89053 RepID=A0AAE4U1Q5_9ACTN|nr:MULTISPECIES: SNF2-related protein [Gordonia]MCR8899219.1 SNF2-related protein [Gordonia sp. GONU]MCZ4652197.1 SNF2-related protein [Gordonia amicalis]MDV6308395.1 SNF2-related protein [Gordonia amicalis]MDV6314194.1 SNF2-related protein [Gordonia amicalis]
MSCDLVDVDALATQASDAPSVQVWQQLLRGEDETPLPLAAHAEVDPTGTAMTTADFARTAMRACLTTDQLLRDRLRAQLRPYQVRGVAWLASTAESEGGAVLADEMGLGKTVQAVGLLSLRVETGPQLVVCPTSLVTNWAHEITRFAPGLTVYTGAARRVDAQARIALTGTPIENSLDELWAILRVVAPSVFPHRIVSIGSGRSDRSPSPR